MNNFKHAWLTLWILLAVTACGPQPETSAPPPTPQQIHEDVLTVDTHVDTTFEVMDPHFDLGERHNVEEDGSNVDFIRMKEGGLDAIFFAVFVGQGPRTPEAHAAAREKAVAQFEGIRRAVDENRELVELALTPDDAYRLEKKGQRALYIGMENGYPIGTDLSLVQMYYDMGARYITLCHGGNNEICDSATDDDGPEHGGLSDFGRDVVREMNRLGMMVDVSHISDDAFHDVVEVSTAPVIATHSCTRALCDHPRNMTDDMIRRLAEQGGVIQITLVKDFVRTPPPNPARDAELAALRDKYGDYGQMSAEEQEKAREEWRAIRRRYPPAPSSVAQVVDHIDHVVQLVGIDHVGIGTDFDGGGWVDDCRDVSQLPNITAELVRRGYTADQIRQIWGGNAMRVFREAEATARRMKNGA